MRFSAASRCKVRRSCFKSELYAASWTSAWRKRYSRSGSIAATCTSPLASRVLSSARALVIRLRLEEPLEHRDPELAADDRGDAQRALALRREAVDARKEETLQRVGDLHVRDLGGRDPAVVAALDRTAVDEHPDHLLHEERIALRLREDVLARLRWERLDVQEVPHERARLGPGEGIEADLDERVAEEVARPRDEAPALALAVEPGGRHDEQRQLVRERYDVEEQIDRRTVGPVEVLERDDHGTRRRERPDDADDR